MAVTRQGVVERNAATVLLIALPTAIMAIPIAIIIMMMMITAQVRLLMLAPLWAVV